MLAGMGVACAAEAPVPHCCRCCGGARGFAGAGWALYQSRVDEIDADTLLRVDTCWSATTGLLLVDLISAVDFSARHLLMALDAGEPYRLARAMAIESAARAAYPSGRTLSQKLVQQSKVLAKDVGHPHAIALSILADGMIATALGNGRRP